MHHRPLLPEVASGLVRRTACTGHAVSASPPTSFSVNGAGFSSKQEQVERGRRTGGTCLTFMSSVLRFSGREASQARLKLLLDRRGLRWRPGIASVLCFQGRAARVFKPAPISGSFLDVVRVHGLWVSGDVWGCFHPCAPRRCRDSGAGPGGAAERADAWHSPLVEFTC